MADLSIKGVFSGQSRLRRGVQSFSPLAQKALAPDPIFPVRNFAAATCCTAQDKIAKRASKSNMLLHGGHGGVVTSDLPFVPLLF